MNCNKLSRYLVAAALLVIFSFAHSFAAQDEVSAPLYIAHAGGAYGDQIYTNSLEALNSNYEKGFRFFEMDFSWTSDDRLVAIHDWFKYDTLRQKFYVPDGMKIPTGAQFLQLKSKTGLTQLSLEDVLDWVEKKGDVYIVTDIKSDNIKALAKISTEFRKYKKFIIPQVYNYQEYDEAKKLGYKNVILTLYKMRIVPFEVASFAQNNNPFAITMAFEVAESGLAYHLATKYNTRVYAHTVNDSNQFKALRKIGVYGIYTDSLLPSE